jgi:hypothetical protein
MTDTSVHKKGSITAGVGVHDGETARISFNRQCS